MVWTPEDLERSLREQLRAAALVRQESEKRNPWLHRAWRRLKGLWADGVLLSLWVVTLGGSLVAVGLLASAWPLGGGSEQSSLAIAQGSSLIFVVILVGLLSGPIEAGRRVGLGTAVVANDRATWLGLGWVALLSLVLLALGWSQPNSREELATIAITASGLGATGLVARRLLGLSNPSAHLEDRLAKSLKAVRALVTTGHRTTGDALRQAGIESAVASKVAKYPDTDTQRQVALRVQGFTTIAARAWRDGDWILAARAHYFATAVAHEYLSLIHAIDSQDFVFRTLVNETDDLHEVTGGPHGRKLSQALLAGLAGLGIAVASKDGVVDQDGHNPGVFGFVYELGTMIGRRATDQKSEDPAAGLRAMGDIAAACAARGAVWSSVTTGERVLEWAAAATTTNIIHIAMTAWGESLRILMALAQDPAIESHPHAFEAALDDLSGALRKVEKLPPWSLPSALGPILRSSSDGTHPTLQIAFYTLWEAADVVLKAVVEFGRDVSWELVRLLGTVEDRRSHDDSKEVGEVLYQWICAAATRGRGLASTERAHAQVVDSIANTLGWLRSLLVAEGEVRERYDLDELLHMYVSGWEVVLYLVRDADALPKMLEDELDKFLSALDNSTMPELPDTLEDALQLVSGWLAKVGAGDASERVSTKARTVPPLDYGPWGPPYRSGWGMGGREYFARRGGLIPAVVSDVEEFFRCKTEEG